MRWRTAPEISVDEHRTAITTASAPPATPHCLKKKPLVQQRADAAGADHTEDRRHADVDLEAVEQERRDLGHRLRDHAPAQPLHRVRAHRVDGLDRTGVDPLDVSEHSLPSVPIEPIAIAIMPAVLVSPKSG